MSAINDLTRYLDFLRGQGYCVSLSCFMNNFEPYTHKLLEYEIHPHSVCNYLKANKSTQGRCVANKRKLEKKDFKEIYYACCFAGVEEYVIPVKEEDKFLMCVNVSGFRGSLDKSKQRRAEIAKICDDRFLSLYNELPTQVPSLEQVLRFANPIIYMIKELYKECRSVQKSGGVSPTGQIYVEAVRYIHDNFMHSIACEDVAAHLNYSPSYIRHIFKKEGGITVAKKINEIRLENAKKLLINTNMSITDVAVGCGFCDSNYFSTVFKKKYGEPPREHRACFIAENMI